MDVIRTGLRQDGFGLFCRVFTFGTHPANNAAVMGALLQPMVPMLVADAAQEPSQIVLGLGGSAGRNADRSANGERGCRCPYLGDDGQAVGQKINHVFQIFVRFETVARRIHPVCKFTGFR